jgi:hypothetical protein
MLAFYQNILTKATPDSRMVILKRINELQGDLK